MMLTALVLASALLESGNLDTVAARKLLASHIEQFQDSVNELTTTIEGGFTDHVNHLQTGMIVASDDEIGPDGLHPVTVLMVFAKSPASASGVKPGDRVLRIGQRRIEHEPSQVVRMLLDTGRPVTLTLQRGSEQTNATVTAGKLPCVSQAMNALDKKPWLKWMTTMQVISTAMKKDLDDHPGDPVALKRVGTELSKLERLLPKVMELLQQEMTEVTFRHCDARSE